MVTKAQIQADMTALQAAFTAALPFGSAPRAAILALKKNAAALIAEIDQALAGAAGTLDAFPADTDPDLLVADVLALTQSSQDQLYFADLRGLMGRVTSNLDQIPKTAAKPLVTPATSNPAPPSPRTVLTTEGGLALTTETGEALSP